MNKITRARLALSSLTVYRGILKDETVSKYIDMLEKAHGIDISRFLTAYGEFFNSLSKCSVSFFAGHLADCLKFDDNTYTRRAAGGLEINLSLQAAAENDTILFTQAVCTAAEIKAEAAEYFEEDLEEEGFINRLPEWDERFFELPSASELADFYRKNGCGIYARYGAFRWENGLCGVQSHDTVHLCDLKNYEYERSVVVDNTLEFLNGCSANNLLLYGDRGTGKSSTVKAVFNEYRDRGLRIIEVPKDSIADFSGIVQKIADIPLKFIIFIDDLSFASDDDNYAALKAVLEGGLAVRPRNTVIYATSNRRHFVKESFAEREGDDVHAADAMQEKLSLADRFGITVTFSAPDQRLYLDIVTRLAADRCIEAPKEALERGALRWALMYNGRSPRTARQYVDWAQARAAAGRSVDDV